jgi:hypothetical protein
MFIDAACFSYAAAYYYCWLMLIIIFGHFFLMITPIDYYAIFSFSFMPAGYLPRHYYYFHYYCYLRHYFADIIVAD